MPTGMEKLKIKRVLRFFHGPHRHTMGVYHGCCEACVAKESLDNTDVVASLEQMSGERYEQSLFSEYLPGGQHIERFLHLGFMHMKAPTLI